MDTRFSPSAESLIKALLQVTTLLLLLMRMLPIRVMIICDEYTMSIIKYEA